jgi:hypothetical protein
VIRGTKQNPASAPSCSWLPWLPTLGGLAIDDCAQKWNAVSHLCCIYIGECMAYKALTCRCVGQFCGLAGQADVSVIQPFCKEKCVMRKLIRNTLLFWGAGVFGAGGE